jgi:hypothetical protein
LIGVSADIWAIDRLRDAGDFALAHGATQHAAEQALADIATFEAEKANQALKEGHRLYLNSRPTRRATAYLRLCARTCPWVRQLFFGKGLNLRNPGH